MNNLLAKLGIAVPTSVALTETLNLDTLWNALISVAVAICSVLAVEGANWLKNWFIKHSKEKKDSKSDKE